VPLFLVRYHYTGDAQAQDLIRPAHRSWLASLPTLVGSGPTADNGAALVFEAESGEDVATLLADDPFALGGYIGERTIVQWNVVLGRWAAKP
jgi:uncharacterized protein YciI